MAVSDIADGDAGRNPFEEALSQLVSRIRSGELPTGTQLPPERDLSGELAISRNTLRAVIRALQQAGYIRTQRGRSGGSFVVWEGAEQDAGRRRLSEHMKDRLLDMLTFRSVLEPGAAALVAGRRLTTEEATGLTDRLSAETSAGLDFRLADAELHRYIAELSQCKALIDAIDNVQLILNETLLQVVPFMGPALEHSHEQHAQLVAAIIDRRADDARDIMHDHVSATAELLRTFLD